MAEAIVLLVDDLMFAPRLDGALKQLGYHSLFATNETDLTDALRHAPVLVIVDLFSRGFDWEMLLRFMKGEGKKSQHVPVLGFGPHVDLELREKALLAGCDTVVGRGAIANQLAQLVEKHKWVVDRNRCQEVPPPGLQKGIELFNQGEYYLAHDELEEAWRRDHSAARDLYRGILQVGIAYYQIERGNYRGAMKMLLRVRQWLDPLPDICRGVDVAQLREDAAVVQDALLDNGPGNLADLDRTLFKPVKLADE